MEPAAQELAQTLVQRAGQALADSLMPHHVHIVSTKGGNRLEVQIDGRHMVSMESDHPVDTADALRAWTHKLLVGKTR
jgi:hypothetical protein